MLFYKTALKHKSLKLAVGQNIVKIVDVLDHFANLCGVVVL